MRRTVQFTKLFAALGLLIWVNACSSADEGKPEPANPIPTGSEETMLRDAEETYDDGLYSVARDYWSQFLEAYPNSEYAAFAELKIADAHFYAAEYSESIAAYESFIREHPRHEAVPYAQIQIGNAFAEQYKGTVRDQAPLKNAIKNYNKLVGQFPKSEYSLLAKRKVNAASEQLADYDAFVLKFYVKQGQTAAAANRLQKLFETYPHTKVVKNLIRDLKDEYPEQTDLVLASVKKSKAQETARAQMAQPIPAPKPIAEENLLPASEAQSRTE